MRKNRQCIDDKKNAERAKQSRSRVAGSGERYLGQQGVLAGQLFSCASAGAQDDYNPLIEATTASSNSHRVLERLLETHEQKRSRAFKRKTLKSPVHTPIIQKNIMLHVLHAYGSLGFAENRRHARTLAEIKKDDILRDLNRQGEAFREEELRAWATTAPDAAEERSPVVRNQAAGINHNSSSKSSLAWLSTMSKNAAPGPVVIPTGQSEDRPNSCALLPGVNGNIDDPLKLTARFVGWLRDEALPPPPKEGDEHAQVRTDTDVRTDVSIFRDSVLYASYPAAVIIGASLETNVFTVDVLEVISSDEGLSVNTVAGDIAGDKMSEIRVSDIKGWTLNIEGYSNAYAQTANQKWSKRGTQTCFEQGDYVRIRFAGGIVRVETGWSDRPSFLLSSFVGNLKKIVFLPPLPKIIEQGTDIEGVDISAGDVDRHDGANEGPPGSTTTTMEGLASTTITSATTSMPTKDYVVTADIASLPPAVQAVLSERKKLFGKAIDISIELPYPQVLQRTFLDGIMSAVGVMLNQYDQEKVYLIKYGSSMRDDAANAERLSAPVAIKLADLPFDSVGRQDIQTGYRPYAGFFELVDATANLYRRVDGHDGKAMELINELYKWKADGSGRKHDFHRTLLTAFYQAIAPRRTELVDIQKRIFKAKYEEAWAQKDIRSEGFDLASLAWWKTQPEVLEVAMAAYEEMLQQREPTKDERDYQHRVEWLYSRLDEVGLQKLDIDGFVSFDIVVAIDTLTGRHLLYIPGAAKPFTEHINDGAMKQWLAEQCQTPERIVEIARHFTIRAGQVGFNDQFQLSGVTAYLATLGAAVLEGLPAYVDLSRINQLSASERAIDGNLFESQVNAALKAIGDDVEISIKTVGEIQKAELMNLYGYFSGIAGMFGLAGLPFSALFGSAQIALGMQQARDGDTAADRRSGKAAALSGALDLIGLSPDLLTAQFTGFSSTKTGMHIGDYLTEVEKKGKELPTENLFVCVQQFLRRERRSGRGSRGGARARARGRTNQAVCPANTTPQINRQNAAQQVAAVGNRPQALPVPGLWGAPGVFDVRNAKDIFKEYTDLGEPVFSVLAPKSKATLKQTADELEAASNVLRHMPLSDAERNYRTTQFRKNNVAVEVIADAFSGGNRGLVIGERHNSFAAHQFIVDNLQALKNAGVRTLYVERMRDVFQHDYAQFNMHGILPPAALEDLKSIEVKTNLDPTSPYTSHRTYLALHAEGIAVVPIDSLASVYQNIDTQTSANTFEIRALTANYYMAQAIASTQSTNQNRPWIAVIGAGHALLAHDIRGVAPLSNAWSVNVRYQNDPLMGFPADVELAI